MRYDDRDAIVLFVCLGWMATVAAALVIGLLLK